MTSNASSMTLEERQDASRTSPQNLTRPRLLSYQSSSVPTTPRQHPRQFPSHGRSPSPTAAMEHSSPRSAFSEAAKHTTFFRNTNPACRFQSTQTSRRRIPYSIGADVLEAEPEAPKHSLSKAEEENLSGNMKRLYDDLLPSHTSQESRRRIVHKLRDMLRHEWPEKNVEVFVFGSSGNLLYTDKSDVDICITMRGIDTVCSLAELLSKKGMRGITCVHAKAVPIVKIWDPELQIACDINVNNHVALKNTHLVRAYMELDDRVRPLAMIVKYWTKKRLLNEASGGTLSSYTWTLLVINFLQTRDIPILPVLCPRDEHDRVKDKFGLDLHQHKDFGKANKESLGELFFHFFRRYGHEIDFETAVVSVRKGQLLTKAEKGWVLANNNRLCVEEPFNTDRNLGNTSDDTAFRGVHLELRQAFTRIAQAQKLTNSICEQFEFPVEDHKPLFERPQPGPRPVLSRSTSQSGRGNRLGGTRRGNRQQFDQRNGLNARRSSSAATFGGNGPQLVLPSHNNYYLQQEELSRLSRAMSVEEQNLRFRQAQIIEAQMGQLPPRGATSPAPQNHRTLYNGYPSPRMSNVEPSTGSSSNTQGYPFPQSYESAVAMSLSSSQQGTNTNPNSPMLAPATPSRRGFQRQAALNSPGAAMRSQSQPARPMQMPMMPPNGSRPQFGQMVYPTMQGTGVWPSSLPRPAYYGPYVNSMGVHYLAVPQVETVPREYLGYGIGAVPQFGQFPQAATYAQQQNAVESRSQEGRLSPTRQYSSTSLSTSEAPRSPSPLPRSEPQLNGLHSAPLTATFPRYPPGQQINGRPPEDSAPMIVNGSCAMPPRAQTIDNGESLEHRRASNASRFSRVPSDLSLGAFGPNFHSAHTSNRQPQSGLPALRDDVTPIAENGPAPQLLSSPSSTYDAPAIARSTPDMPPPRRPAQHASHTLPLPEQTSPEAANGLRRSSGGNRQNVPSLDLANAPAERARDSAPTSSTVLSPVEETRTPSPSSNRKHTARRSVQLNGMTVPTPPTPLPTKGEKDEAQKEDANGLAAKKPGSGLGGHSRNASAVNVGASSSSQQSNQWQQAGTGKKKIKKGNPAQSPVEEKKKKGGEPMPANEAARKGG